MVCTFSIPPSGFRINIITWMAVFLLAAAVHAQDGLLVFSWNIKDLGQSKNAEEIHFIAEQVRSADILAIQEVVAGDGGAQAVARLADELNRMGAKWDYRISDPTDSPKYSSERYAFLWKTSRATLLGRPALEKRLAGRVAREPYVARFKVEKRELLIVNFHSVPWNKNPEGEVQYLELFPQFYPDIPILFAGDYNLPDDAPVFDRLKQRSFQAVLHNQPTTVRRTNGFENGGYLLHPIDNIFCSTKTIHVRQAGIVDFVQKCASLEEANQISDHVPVWAALVWREY